MDMKYVIYYSTLRVKDRDDRLFIDCYVRPFRDTFELKFVKELSYLGPFIIRESVYSSKTQKINSEKGLSFFFSIYFWNR